jgi:hypothetical protein
LIDSSAVKPPFRQPFLFIKTKKGELTSLKLNKAQRRLHDIIVKLWNENKIIRLIILKARQLGASTYIEALFYALISQGQNQNALIMANLKDKTNYIFEMSKLYQEKCPPYLRPNIKKSNEKKLEFEGNHSQILIDSAENRDAGRALTLQFCHLSEYALFKRADEIMLGLSHSVPTMPHTIMVKESTANGYNHFKDEWDAAIAGENDYVPIFIPWYWGEEYMMPTDEHFEIGDPALGDITIDEPALARQMEKELIDHIPERLAWRRWDIKNNCKGDVEKFKQEMPSTPEEAFLASGACYFDQKKLVQQLNMAKPPLFRANILKENFKWVIRRHDDGEFMFFEEPNKYGQYCIGGDAASGSGTDYAALVARNKDNNNVAVIYHAKCDPDELAYRAMILGSFLNNAKVAIENDKFGFAANQKLITIYGNVYVSRTYDKTKNKMTESFGWDTTKITRPMILAQMQQEIRDGNLKLSYVGTVDRPGLIRECLTFIKNPESGKAEAEEGKNDDLVIACAISGQLRADSPYQLPPDKRAGVDINSENKNSGMRFSRRE